MKHWIAVKRLFQYLRDAASYSLKFGGKGTLDAVDYSAVDWAG